jgi:predicted metalloprotease
MRGQEEGKAGCVRPFVFIMRPFQKVRASPPILCGQGAYSMRRIMIAMGSGALILALGYAFAPPSLRFWDARPPAPRTQAGEKIGPVAGNSCADAKYQANPACQILAAANASWAKAFPAGKYVPAQIRFYAQTSKTGCGTAQSAMGPFYCPADKSIYLDETWLQTLSQAHGTAAKPATAYSVAHEVGHHIQYLTGIVDQIRAYQKRLPAADSEKLQTALDLQADCYAGVWAAQNGALTNASDMENGLRLTQAEGAKLKRQPAAPILVPENFSLGSVRDRLAWLKRGLDTGDPDRCDPFQTVRLEK